MRGQEIVLGCLSETGAEGLPHSRLQQGHGELLLLSMPAGYTLDLYDMKEALVKRVATGQAEAGKHFEQEILAGELGKGLYLARLTTKGKVQTVKLLVQR